MKKCYICQIEKPLDDFHKKAASKDGRQPGCKPCKIASVKKWQEENPEKHQANVERNVRGPEALLRRRAIKYGLTVEELKLLIEQAGGVCAICKLPPRQFLVVDHCHKSSLVRGMLCEKCNQGLGMFNDNPEVLRDAIKYLNR